MARFRVTVLDHPATLAGHMAAWNDLAAAALEPNVFYEPWMLLPAIDSFGRGRELRYVLVYADQGNAPPLLCGLFPLERAVRYNGLPFPHVRLWQHKHCFLGTPLVRAAHARACLDTFLDWLEGHLDELLAQEPEAVEYAVQRSCEIKAQIVAADEREHGRRAELNFGHTFGHAIEAGLGYGTWLHGEAVGCGMVMAADLSARLRLIDQATAERIARLVARAGLPTRGPALGVERYLELMRLDKKARAGAMRHVVIESLGRATVRTVEDDMVAQVLGAHAG